MPSWPVLAGPFASQHLGSRHLAVVRASPDAQAAYETLVPESSFPPGSVIVESLTNEASGAPGPVLALEKTADDWRYWQLSATGQLERADASAACAGCHAAAPVAPLFGLPRPTATPSPATTAPAPQTPVAPAPASPTP